MTSGFRRFLALFVAQTMSMTGGGLTGFALGIWVFQRTGSATDFALLSVCTMLPGVVALPVAGALTDRWGARRALLVADLGGALVGAALVALFVFGIANVALLCVLLTLGALVTSLHWPAYTSATTALVPAASLPRAASLMQFGYVGQQVLAPALAGVMLGATGLSGVLAADAVTFACAALVVVTLGLPRAAASPSSRGPSIGSDLRRALVNVRDRGLLRLAAYVAMTYLPGGFVIALSTPLVLTFATPRAAGVVMSIMGLGMIVGSVVATTFVKNSGGVRRLVRFDMAMAVAMLTAGIAASTVLVAIAGFVFLFGLAGHMSEEQALWQVRVESELQGRAIAVKRMLTWASLPVSYGLAGPLADRVFEPLMAEGGALATSLGPILGTGRGRGIALLLMCAGALKLVTAIVASRDTALLRLNDHRS